MPALLTWRKELHMYPATTRYLQTQPSPPSSLCTLHHAESATTDLRVCLTIGGLSFCQTPTNCPPNQPKRDALSDWAPLLAGHRMASRNAPVSRNTLHAFELIISESTPLSGICCPVWGKTATPLLALLTARESLKARRWMSVPNLNASSLR